MHFFHGEFPGRKGNLLCAYVIFLSYRSELLLDELKRYKVVSANNHSDFKRVTY